MFTNPLNATVQASDVLHQAQTLAPFAQADPVLRYQPDKNGYAQWVFTVVDEASGKRVECAITREFLAATQLKTAEEFGQYVADQWSAELENQVE